MSWLDDVVQFSSGQIDDRVREALWARGVDDDQIAKYRLGYLNRHLPEIDLPKDFLSWSGHGEKLVDSYVLPITNLLGEVKGLQFRAVDRGVGGYMDYFSDETEPAFFGLGEAAQAMWDREEVVLVEGGFDLFPIQRVVPATVATLTARVTEQFARLLRRIVKRVYISYDRDKRGQQGTSHFIRYYGKGFEVAKPIEYPEVKMIDGKIAKDPNEIWEAWGDERLDAHLRCILDTNRTITENNHAPDFF